MTRSKRRTPSVSRTSRARQGTRADVLENPPSALDWVGGVRGHVSMTDQTLLPGKIRRFRIRDTETMWDAIQRLAVRGAPAIGVAAAYGVVLGARTSTASTAKRYLADVRKVRKYLASSRPTAVNLFWALDRMGRAAEAAVQAGTGAARGNGKNGKFDPTRVTAALLDEAKRIHQEDRELCRAIGRHGGKVLRSGWSVLTHCHAGALATGGAGTALAVVYGAIAAGKKIRVYADETRPLLQGARLTAWELQQVGVDVTLLCDGAAASLLATGAVDCIVTGADRIAANGDAANKIGTYSLAVLAREHKVPFYIAAPSTTFDLAIRSGADIPIEQRDASEVTEGFGRRTAPAGVAVYNPAFDVTPARYIAGIVTEAGVLRKPYRSSIRRAIRPLLA